MNYAQQKIEAIAKAQAALKSGDLAAAKSHREDAEKYAALEAEAAAVTNLQTSTSTKSATRPTLPGTGAMPNAGAQDADQGNPYKSFAYVTRFGTLDSSVKSILTDLHGSDHEQMYWDQRMAFNTYLRRGERELGADQYKLLKTIVLTPSAVKSAIMQGMDDVSLLKATLVESIDTLGGFAVPVDFNARVIERMQGMTIMRGRSSIDSTSRDQLEFPAITGGDDQFSSAVRMTWVGETPVAGAAATNLTFGMESIPVHTVMAETPLSRNNIEDAAFNIENYLVRKFSESSAIDEDNKFLTGPGVGTPQGILPGGTNILGLTEIVTGAGAAMTWNGLIKMTYGIASQYRQNAVWMGSRHTYESIALLKNSADEYLWRAYQYQGGENGQPPRLLGYTPLEQEALPAVAANSYPLIYGDPTGYQIVDRIGMTVERYLDSATARENKIMYVMRRRLGGQVIEPWRFAVQKVAAA